MSLLRKGERIVGLCPDRLVLGPHASVPSAGEPLDALSELAARAKLRVVVSNHFVRYAVLQWSSALASRAEWQSFAEHSFASVYGDTAREWSVRVSGARPGKPRVACALDATLLARLTGMPNVVSIQPHLMAAFNARRRILRERSFWFVVQENGRLTLALVVDGRWKLVRNRQAPDSWRGYLSDLLEREAATEGCDCDVVALCAETPAPSRIGRYEVRDLTLPVGAPPELRQHAMAFNG